MTSKRINNNPWKALQPYEQQDSDIFFGRDTEISQLSALIEYNQAVTLYGKSGTGKSSLLNAGICPNLLLNGFLPHTFHLKSETDFNDPNVPFSKNILSVFGDICPDLDYSAPDIFCRFFNDYFSYNDYGEKTTPVIILDQFEETLIHNVSKAELLLKQIATWMNYRGAVASDCHFVISIREDDLYLLEESIDKNFLNYLKTNRYRLRSISREGAEEVIRKGGKGIIREELVIDKILSILSHDASNLFEVSELSLMCSQLFEIMKKRNMSSITIDMVDKIGFSTIEEYYKSIIKELNLSKDDIDKFENEFVTEDGRRNFVSTYKFYKLFNSETCNKLVSPKSRYKILSVVNDKVEIVHDLLAKAIKSVKDEHAAVNLQQAAKQQEIFCYLSLLPSLLLNVVIVFYVLQPVLLFLSDKHITTFLDFLIYPDIVWKTLCLIPMLLFWIAPKYILNKSKLLKNIDIDKTYANVYRIYIGIFLFFIWFVYDYSSLTYWAPGINVLPFISWGLWAKEKDEKPVIKNTFLCLSCALSFVFLLMVNRRFLSVPYFYFLIACYLIWGISFYNKFKTRTKILILIFIIALTLFSYYNNTESYLLSVLLLLTIIFVYISFKDQLKLCVFYVVMLLGIFITVSKMNPYFIMKYSGNITRIVPNLAFCYTESDSIRIRDAWTGKTFIDWPLIRLDNKDSNNVVPKMAIGVLPIKDCISNNTSIHMPYCFPFVKSIDSKEYYAQLDYNFYNGIIKGGLKEELMAKEKNMSNDPNKNNYDPYYETKTEFIYPIKLLTAEMFNDIMDAISDRIRYKQALNPECNPSYNKIDSICRAYYTEFSKQLEKEEITESDIYYYYKFTVCQLTNALIQEYINKNDIYGTISMLSLLVYLNLSEEKLYQNINSIINYTYTEDDEIQKKIQIKGNIIDEKTEIIKVRELFYMVSTLAFAQQSTWIVDDLTNFYKNKESLTLLDYSSTEKEKQKYNSIIRYDKYPYLKSISQYHGKLLLDIFTNREFKTRFYKPYFEYIGKNLMRIQFMDYSYSNNLRQFAKLKEENDQLESKQLKEKIEELEIEAKAINENYDSIIYQQKKIDHLIKQLK